MDAHDGVKFVLHGRDQLVIRQAHHMGSARTAEKYPEHGIAGRDAMTEFCRSPCDGVDVASFASRDDEAIAVERVPDGITPVSQRYRAGIHISDGPKPGGGCRCERLQQASCLVCRRGQNHEIGVQAFPGIQADDVSVAPSPQSDDPPAGATVPCQLPSQTGYHLGHSPVK